MSIESNCQEHTHTRRNTGKASLWRPSQRISEPRWSIMMSRTEIEPKLGTALSQSLQPGHCSIRQRERENILERQISFHRGFHQSIDQMQTAHKADTDRELRGTTQITTRRRALETLIAPGVEQHSHACRNILTAAHVTSLRHKWHTHCAIGKKKIIVSITSEP